MSSVRASKSPDTHSTLHLSNTNLKIKLWRLSRQQLGALKPELGALWSDYPGHVPVSAVLSCSLLLPGLCNDCFVCLECSSLPSFPNSLIPTQRLPR